MANRKNRGQKMVECARRTVDKEEYGSSFCKRHYNPQQAHEDLKKEKNRRACRRFKHKQREVELED